ncbi:DegT/DnrJ/EryC1/StrS family aminotransferase [Massilia sp. PAMC28688]|uniref:DegT/DnrJ/EryC1/StrS family aminotransferase n=1 Tax=Massilia sp. PAMC28688 TaxID=2861283 RepID=UPI001C6277B1|nr:DegT/DnrJ/EryC1/StrS family aminotransferase [Massilia sp. PAMC28688]QYF91977.1 DegT/DnrJ/EryC1/StrS family aminotransferase [Massilia sp. PAMC28688]
MTEPAIPLVRVAMAPEEVLWPLLREVLYSGQIGEGATVAEFESRFADNFKLPRAFSFHSGTAALHCALVLAGVRHGDEVISTPMTAEPTNLAILHAGGRVVWADVDPCSGNMDPESIAARITPRTRAILVVHYGGLPVRLAEIQAIAARHGIPVIEDCAHALGARYNGQAIGTLAEFGMYSLQAIKHMTTVDGGMLTMRDSDLVTRTKTFRWFGMERGVDRSKVDITEVGYKYHMNNVTAAIGLAQLTIIDDLIGRHKANGRWFDTTLPAIAGIEVARFDPAADPSYWFYTLLSDDSAAVLARLAERGISASKLHRPNNQHSIFADAARELPGLDAFYRRMLHIPCGWWVGDLERERIADALRAG